MYNIEGEFCYLGTDGRLHKSWPITTNAIHSVAITIEQKKVQIKNQHKGVLPRQAKPAADEASPAAVGKLL